MIDMTSSPKNKASDVKTKQALELDVLKIAALGGALLYGVLFLGYYHYYGRLGLRPEDLGVTYTYILVRSVGFTIQMFLIFGAMTAIYLIALDDEGAAPGAEQNSLSIKLYAFGAFAFTAFFSWYLNYLLPRSWPVWISILAPFLIIGLIFICRRIARANRNKGNVIFAALALLVTIVLPTAVVITRANALASRVLEGHQVSPYEVFGVPILDVSVDNVTVTWIGPKDQRPAAFGKNSLNHISGLLLGKESETTVLLIANQENRYIIKLPSALILVEQNTLFIFH